MTPVPMADCFCFGFHGEPLNDVVSDFFIICAQIASNSVSMSDATQEASEVLHTLMSIERIETTCTPNDSQSIEEVKVEGGVIAGNDERQEVRHIIRDSDGKILI